MQRLSAELSSASRSVGPRPLHRRQDRRCAPRHHRRRVVGGRRHDVHDHAAEELARGSRSTDHRRARGCAGRRLASAHARERDSRSQASPMPPLWRGRDPFARSDLGCLPSTGATPLPSSIEMECRRLQFERESLPMRVADLDHAQLLELDPEGGVIRFAGQRALLIDAVAMGLLRKYLVENFGLTAARTVLTQFGFAHGWRMAEAMQRRLRLGQRRGLAPRGDPHPRARRAVPRRARQRGAAVQGRRRRCSPPTKPSSTCCTSVAPTTPCAGRSAASPAAT